MFAHLRIAALAGVSTVAALGIVGGDSRDGSSRASELQAPRETALEAAARQFRVQIYNTYRLDRHEFDRRRAAWARVQANYQDTGSRPETQRAVLDWLTKATHQSRPDVQGALPAAPVFGSVAGGPVESHRPAPTERSFPKDSAERVRKTPNAGRMLNADPSVAAAQTPPPRRVAPIGPPDHAAAPRLSPGVVETRPGPTARAGLPSARSAMLPAPWEVVSPPTPRSATSADAVRRQRAKIGEPAATGSVAAPRRTSASVRIPTGNADGVRPADPAAAPTAINVDRDPATNSKSAAPATIRAPNHLSDISSSPRTPEVIGSGAQIDYAPSRAFDANARAPRIALAKPAISRSAQDLPEVLPEPVEVADAGAIPAPRLNVGELMARASGYGVGLRTVNSLLHGGVELDAPELTELLDELETLLSNRRDLLLYEEIVSVQDRERLVRSLDFPQTTVAALGSRIAAARERLAAQGGLDAIDRDRRLELLEELSKRLSRLSQD